MRWIAMVLGLTVLLLSTGCAMYQAPVMPPNGIVFSNVKAPITTEFGEGTSVPAKQGTASAHGILGLLAFGDASVKAATDEGGLTSVRYVDYDYLSVLFGVYSKFTTIAHGD